VGLLRFDAPVFERVSNNVLKPRMAEYGMTFTDEIAISSPNSIAGFSNVSAQISSAILRLRSDKVTHVMFLENAGILPYLFMPAAEGQEYRPRYGLSSADIPFTLEGQVGPEQLSGSVGVGWTPPNDVDLSRRPHDITTSELCDSILIAAGFAGSGFYTTSACDTIFFIKAVLDRTTDTSPQGFRAAAESLGSDFRSPFTFTTLLGPGRHDGAASVQTFAWDDSCPCYAYVGSRRPAP
jgi:hypothetical protein